MGEFIGEDLVIKTNIEVTTSEDSVTDEELGEAAASEEQNEAFEHIKPELSCDMSMIVKDEDDGNNNEHEDLMDFQNNSLLFQQIEKRASNLDFLHLLPHEPVEVSPEIQKVIKPKRKRQVKKENPKDVPKDEDGNFLCTLCDYKAKQMGHLTAHIDSKHIGLEFPCDLCDFKTRWKNRLNSHKRSIHKEEGGFPCSVCPYLACEKYVLAQHLKQVHGAKEDQKEKSYQCDHCDYKVQIYGNRNRFCDPLDTLVGERWGGRDGQALLELLPELSLLAQHLPGIPEIPRDRPCRGDSSTDNLRL